MEHPYIKYAQALLMEENHLSVPDDITGTMIKEEIKKGLNSFSLKPTGDYNHKKFVKFKYCSDINKATQDIYLAPNAITTDMHAHDLYKNAKKSLETDTALNKNAKICQTEMPIAGEFCSFSEKGDSVGRGNSSGTEYERLLSLITTLTPLKPCLQYIQGTGNSRACFNVCFIPDLQVDIMVDFIKLFKRMRVQKLTSDLLVGKVKCYIKGKGQNAKQTFKPQRPYVFRGNFPNPPRSSALGSVSLLGALGEMTKEKETSELARRVVKGLEDTPIYEIQYGSSNVFTFNHYVIRLASEGNLQNIVDCLYWCALYNKGRRDSSNIIDYEKFDLFSSRFLQLFTHPAFLDFLSFRAEYPAEIELLLKTYFENMEKIDSEIVHSARELGKWLNYVAFLAATKEKNKDKEKSNDEFFKLKAKILVELESSVFSAKTGDALIAQTVTRAGRLSNLDAPEAAALFMEKTCSGDLKLDQAKNLLIAFSRLKNKKEISTTIPVTNQDDSEEENFSDL